MSDMDSRILLGLTYGYPKCCVKHFVLTFDNDRRINLPLHGTGYKPCPSCAVKSEEDLLEAINLNSVFTCCFYLFNLSFFCLIVLVHK
jgi:hypothetical protein